MATQIEWRAEGIGTTEPDRTKLNFSNAIFQRTVIVEGTSDANMTFPTALGQPYIYIFRRNLPVTFNIKDSDGKEFTLYLDSGLYDVLEGEDMMVIPTFPPEFPTEPEPTPSFPKTISRGTYSFEARNDEEERQIKEFLGIDPSGVDLDTYVSELNKTELTDWWLYWSVVFQGLGREDIKTFVNAKLLEYQEVAEPSPTTSGTIEITEEDFIGEEGSFLNPRRINPFSEVGQRLAEEASARRAENPFGIENITATLQAIGLTAAPAIMATLTGLLGGVTVPTTAGAATTAGGGLAAGLGIAGLSISAATAKLAVKGAMGVAGFDGIMVWMASDNVLTGTAFTLRKLREAVKSGAITQEEALTETELVQGWIDAATKLVETSAELNPFILPFRNILLINADKAQKDFDIEVALIKKTFPKK